jgi:hypothetical protein
MKNRRRTCLDKTAIALGSAMATATHNIRSLIWGKANALEGNLHLRLCGHADGERVRDLMQRIGTTWSLRRQHRRVRLRLPEETQRSSDAGRAATGGALVPASHLTGASAEGP